MIFTQFVDDALGCASYLVGDPRTGRAIVVDPAFAIEQYVDEAQRHDVRIVRVIETHTHADHLSGHGRLALEHGVPVSIHPAAETQYPNDSLEDGAEIVLGDIVLRCIHTPGHRPEHCCLAVSDRTRSPDPWIVLTGDSLFVGAQQMPSELAAAPDGVQLLDVRPVDAFAAGHVAGALSVPVSGTRFSTKAAFVVDAGTVVVSAQDEDEVALAVRGLHAVGHLEIEGYILGGGPKSLDLVSIDQLDALLEAGAELIDVREKDERDTGYIAGSRNIPYRLLTLGEADLPRDRPIVTICETGPRAAIAASILAAHGFDAHPVWNGGIDSWVAAGKPTVEFRRCGG